MAPSINFAHWDISKAHQFNVGTLTQSSRVRNTGGLARDISSCSTSKSIKVSPVILNNDTGHLLEVQSMRLPMLGSSSSADKKSRALTSFPTWVNWNEAAPRPKRVRETSLTA